MKLPRHRLVTIFELVVILIIIATLIWMALKQISFVLVTSERVVVQMNISNMRRSLSYQEAIYKAKGKDLKDLVSSNPMNLMQMKSGTYLADKQIKHYNLIPRGSWYFNNKLKVLNYKVRFKDYFKTSPTGQFKIALHITPTYGVIANTAKKTITGVNLKIILPYQWCLEPDYFSCKKWSKIKK